MGLTKRIEEIDIAKGIGILLVVLGHSFPDANSGIQNGVAQGIFSWIYSFHMALFMSMAGALFYTKWNGITSKKDAVDEIKKRAKRLLIPYLFFSVLIFAAKSITSLGRKSVSIDTLIGIAFGNSPCGNMWFLWTLFIISAITLCLPTKLDLWINLVGGYSIFSARCIPGV